MEEAELLVREGLDSRSVIQRLVGSDAGVVSEHKKVEPESKEAVERMIARRYLQSSAFMKMLYFRRNVKCTVPGQLSSLVRPVRPNARFVKSGECIDEGHSALFSIGPFECHVS